jgi:prophage maintenance system killer protein/phage regulator Rha-like protein
MNKKTDNRKALIFQAKNGAIELRGDTKKQTIWATQAQIAEVFGIERSVVTKHINGIFKDEELQTDAVCAKFAHTASDGKTYQIMFYNLDIILSIGYRTNSTRAIQFRQWANKTLRQHITKGYTINPRVVKRHYAEFQDAIENIKFLLPEGSAIDHASVLELISTFANTWLSLDAYDKDELPSKGMTKKNVAVTAEQLSQALVEFKAVLVKKGEATELFGREGASGSIEGIIGNVMQSFAGQQMYSTVEEKAANLLYFVVKNHPFIDGNKRSGAYAFIWFLRRAGILEKSKITPPALTAITLFIAESDPRNKERMVKLVVQMLRK